MIHQATVTTLSKNYYLISLPGPLPGFDDFLSVWVHTGKPSFIVDVGPAITTHLLKSALGQINIRKLDYILLTHIHLDHAGGIGQISDFFPDAKVVCHPKAMAHLTDPAQLWKGSLKTLGDIARAYGRIIPIKQERLLNVEKLEEPSISAFKTPGHAPHHLSFMTDFFLFAGEACGVHIRLDSKTIYHRPATPPKFFLETTLNSIDCLIRQNPEKICFGHFGTAKDAVYWLEFHKKQLILWKEIIAHEWKNQENDTFFSNCMKKLIKEDPFFAPFAGLDPPVQSRERDLIKNSVQGFVGYLNSFTDNSQSL